MFVVSARGGAVDAPDRWECTIEFPVFLVMLMKVRQMRRGAFVAEG